MAKESIEATVQAMIFDSSGCDDSHFPYAHSIPIGGSRSRIDQAVPTAFFAWISHGH